MLLCLASYEQCSARLLKVLHKGCNTDVLGILLIYPHSPSGAARPYDRAYISVKPLAAVLQPINICVCVCVCVYVCVCVCLDIGKLTEMSHLTYSILLAQLIATLIHYPCTVALTDLAD